MILERICIEIYQFSMRHKFYLSDIYLLAMLYKSTLTTGNFFACFSIISNIWDRFSVFLYLTLFL